MPYTGIYFIESDETSSRKAFSKQAEMVNGFIMTSERGRCHFYQYIAFVLLVGLTLDCNLNDSRAYQLMTSIQNKAGPKILLVQAKADEEVVVTSLINRTSTEENAIPVNNQSLSIEEMATLLPKPQTSVGNCVPLLTSQGGWVKSEDKTLTLKWKVPESALKECGLSSQYLVPLQSSPEDIKSKIEKKWVVFTGDSSTRMLFDYFLGRLVGNWTSWPSDKYNNHGPPHSIKAGDCTRSYEFWHQGFRLTFIWTNVNVTMDTFDRFDEIKRRTVGSPDIIFAQHGYWDKLKPGEKGNVTLTTGPFIEYLEKWVDFQELHNEFPLAYPRNSTTHKVWLSLFHPCYNNDQGVAHAQRSNWTIFNRTSIVDPFPVNESFPYSGPHPMNEILEMELELVLALINIA